MLSTLNPQSRRLVAPQLSAGGSRAKADQLLQHPCYSWYDPWLSPRVSCSLSRRSLGVGGCAFNVTVPSPKVTGGYTVNDTGCFAESPIDIVKYTGDTVHLPLRGV